MNVAGERDVCVSSLLERLGELANPADVGSFLVDAESGGASDDEFGVGVARE